MATGPKRALLIEGWRFIHHSYAIVAQSHALALERRGDVALAFQDLPFPVDGWTSSLGILDPDDERRLESLHGPDPGFSPEATLRFARDFTAPFAGRAFVFDTPEFRVLRPGVQRKLRDAPPDRVHVLVPSRWAA